MITAVRYGAKIWNYRLNIFSAGHNNHTFEMNLNIQFFTKNFFPATKKALGRFSPPNSQCFLYSLSDGGGDVDRVDVAAVVAVVHSGGDDGDVAFLYRARTC